ncbi:hypothetical protein PC129_g20339 [Phytophthora cactorum]|uniref:Uncharacterized protein n=1 Tax=Phytophthora cactorum TaxID=29920 RepID=A0A329RGX6_9STRA|nr:hypothetical protein Pcac1_g14047 [Phytophthora cactorum]KAG2797612.1 hypothetical protein PC111_g21224 [Phytophthora cactorum]KAG2797733.1 hypothetical protein PC112_g21660 [Phytophthora cactorum]KAG2827646.1 hypothetical protein PC113_g21593 [Phytophthora cactorum]KAG2876741.1 hypothetical protein PC114_g24040 [Phytophthora cactorum]
MVDLANLEDLVDPGVRPYLKERRSPNTGGNPGGGFPSGGYGKSYVSVQAPFGMLSHIKNAVRMIQPFYSDESSAEKVMALWGALERVTVVLAVKRSESV